MVLSLDGVTQGRPRKAQRRECRKPYTTGRKGGEETAPAAEQPALGLIEGPEQSSALALFAAAH
ncbi:hypothetical protein W911_05095 [Hyphomicrobium nitrativorans NL23]|uniref:Uncharacterized protein n=1 Tax=Hyphomicrobium nitrativorans NL23 TaxID=1029756 RepID=V5SGJ9_9HYPH|nr:hypothetical protein W911_05095 [Hyphomicrobium nitrativorans NL23]